MVAAISAALIIAQQVASKATRDVLFLSAYGADELPLAMLGSAGIALVGVAMLAPVLARFGPSRTVPALFLVSAAIYCLEAVLQADLPGPIAYAVFLHVSLFGAVVVSGFWSVVNERFDPHSAKRFIGKIAAGAACGGVLGGVLAERVASTFGAGKLLVVLAGLQVVAAIGVALVGEGAQKPNDTTRGAFSVLAGSTYLRRIAWTVVLLAFAGALLDYVLKAEADARIVGEERLTRFFAAYYTGVGLLTFALQSTVAKRLLSTLGIGKTIATLPLAMMFLSGLGVLVTRLWSVVLLRGMSSVLESSLFRSGYELLYTPVSTAKKRPTKLLIDVAGNRLGDMLGSGLVLLLLLIVPVSTTMLSMALAAIAATGALILVGHLQRGYVAELASSLKSGTLVFERADDLDATTRATFETTMGLRRGPLLEAMTRAKGTGDSIDIAAGRPSLPPPEEEDLPEMLQRLQGEDWKRTARALQKAARRHVGQLIDALLDESLELSIRKRLPRVIASVPSRRVVTGLMEALSDPRFEIRYRAGVALGALLARHTSLRPPREEVFALAAREVRVGRNVWESQARIEEEEGGEDLGSLLRQRRDRSLEHVFNLLGLTFDRDTLRIALQALASGDRSLEGTALEYLENILPDTVRDGLWPYIAPEGLTRRARRPAGEIVDELLSSMDSLKLDRRELLQRMEEPRAEPRAEPRPTEADLPDADPPSSDSGADPK